MPVGQSGLTRERRKMVISLTPLIDIVFILVIFFMLASSFTRTHAVDMATPHSGGKPGKPATGDPVRLAILGSGKFRVGTDIHDGTTLPDLMAGWAKDRKVVVKASEAAVLQDIVWLMDQAARQGLVNFTLTPRTFKEKAAP